MSARAETGAAAARCGTLAAILCVLTLIAAGPAPVAKNLLNNGGFTHGSGDSVDGWRTDGWILTPGTTDYHWIAPANGQPGELEVFTHRDNDARWVQQLNLGPGWYHISAQVSTHDVLPFFTGANISLLEDGIVSRDLRGGNGWTRLGFYLKVGPKGADVDVALRLGGYMNLTRGQAFFRDAIVERVAGPPNGAARIYDLDKTRKSETTKPSGARWTLYATYAFFAILALIGWRLMDAPKVKAVARRESERPPRPRKRA
jgi:hypothetical protein